MTTIRCPNCGRVGTLNEGVKVPKAVRCPKCRTAFAPVSIETGEDASDVDSAVTADSHAKPWYKDPILRFTLAVPLIAALAMGIYLFREQSKAKFQREMVALKESADQAKASGKIRDAYDLYVKLVENTQSASDEKVNEIAHQAETERDGLFPQVKAQLDREEAEIKRIREEALQVAAFKAQQEAEAKARKEAEERRKAEETKLAQFTANLRGGAWVVKGGGQSDILRGLNIYVLKRNVLKADLNEVLSDIQNDDNFSSMGGDIRDLPSKPDNTEVNLEQLHTAIRFADLGESDSQKMLRIELDFTWPRIVKKALVAEATTSIDGKYEIRGLKGGHYLIYAREITRFSAIEWLIPLDIESTGDITKDFYNGTAVAILNKEN